MCKDINTFILTNKENIKNFCKNLNSDFKIYKGLVVICERDKNIQCDGNNCEKCKYNGRKTEATVRVKCENGLPVHLESSKN